MPRNTRGGTGHKKRKNKPTIKTRKLDEIAKDFNVEEGESYGYVVGALGNRRFKVRCQCWGQPETLQEIVCSLKGSYRRRIDKNDFVLVKLFDFKTDQGVIIDSYKPDEIANLKDAGMWDFPEDHESKTENKQDPLHGLPSDSDSESDQETEEQEEIKTIAQTVRDDALDDDIDIDAI